MEAFTEMTVYINSREGNSASILGNICLADGLLEFMRRVS